MKKFLLSLCAVAVAGVCLFMTSCKDDDDPIIYNNIKAAIEQVQDKGEDVKYEYNLNGTTYSSLDALQNAINNLPADTEFTITVTETKGGQTKTATSNGRTPKAGQSSTVEVIVPSIDNNKNETVVVNMTASTHSGGSASTN